MSKLTSFLGEYFLGTGFQKFQREQRALLAEYWPASLPSGKLQENIKLSKKQEIDYDIFGKTIPNLVDVFSITASISSLNPNWLYLIPISEVFRNYMQVKYNSKKIFWNVIRSQLEISAKTEDISDKFENLKRKIRGDGEGWRQEE